MAHIHNWTPFRWVGVGDAATTKPVAWSCECGALDGMVDKSDSDPVHRPAHYNWHPSGVECIEIAGAFDYFLGNVIKYVWRADHKGKPVEDLRKAQTYLAKAIEQREQQ